MRYPDWTDRLFAAVAERERAPFAWGRNDCVLFAAACVDAMTDSDWVAALSRLYHDEATGRAYVASSGGIEAAVTARLGEPVAGIPRRGDVCLLREGSGAWLGVGMGTTIAAPGPDGVIYLPLRAAVKHWRV